MTLQSLSLFVGTGDCNAHCAHCAGRIHRKHAPKKDGIVNENLICKTIKECFFKGARSLSISSSGEPTLSPLAVTKTLELIYNSKKEDIKFAPINLYSNGIRIGEDKKFCDQYLSLWKSLGLTTIYITVHDINEKNNANIYGIEKYPSLETIISRIHNAGLLIRANLMLSRRTIYTFDKFVSTVSYLKKINVDFISAWSIRDIDDKVDKKLSPLEDELDKIGEWIENNKEEKYKIRLLRENNRVLYETNKKLTLFPDETLSSSWCN